MIVSRRAFALGGVAIAALAGPALAMGADAFTVSGKKGPYLKQVAKQRFGAGGKGGSGSLGLASDAVNQGRFQTARLRMPQTEAKIAEMVATLDGHWPYEKGPVPTVHIVGLNYYNAYSLPDNSIVVGFGLLDQAQSDDEAAFILAHELGHLRLGHFNQRGSAFNSRSMISGLGQLYVVGSALHSGAKSLRGGGNGVDAFNASAVSAAARAGATTDFLSFLNNTMVPPSHSREQEDQADAIGYDLSQAASYSADSASARVFDTIQADTSKRQETSTGLQKQLDVDLSKVVDPSTAQSLVNGTMTRGDMAGVLMKGAGAFAQGMASRGGGQSDGPKHRSPEERKKGIAQYSTDAYPQGAPLRDEQKGWLQQVRSTAEYTHAKVVVGAVYEAMQKRSAGDYPGAGRAIAQARKTSYGTSPLVLNEAARLRDDMGETTQADKLFRQAHASPDQTVDGYVDHVRMLYRTQQNDPAVEIIATGIQRFDNDDKPFLSLQIAVAKQMGQEDRVDFYLKRCNSFNDQNLSNDCKLAAGRTDSSGSGSNTPQAPKLPSLPFSVPGFPHR
jgi:Zn-dependent protease with chaperone function